MATPPEQPWSNHEKNYLLAEIIKATNPPPQLLFNVLRDRNIQPRWEDIPLPPGRSLNSCRFAFEELRRSLQMPSMPTPMAGPHTPTPLSQPPVTLKRPYHFDGGPYSAGASGREIRPKPHAGVSYSQPSPTEPPIKRKRGRPTKAEAQAKAELAAAAASASGEIEPTSVPASASASAYVPTTASTSRPSTQTPAPIIAPPAPPPVTTQEANPSQPTSTSMPIAAMLTPNIREPKSASQSSSSSGKRRRARSTKSEPEETPLTRAGADYESPYGRVRGGPGDSPARAAVLRHREDPSRPSGHDPATEQQLREPTGSEPPQ